MVSIKNRLFTTTLIDAFCRFASECLHAAYITVVDRPYIHNVLAASDRQNSQRQIDGVRRLSEDRVRQVRRILRRFDTQRLSFIGWDDLAAQTPSWMTEEIQNAWRGRGCVYSDLLAHGKERANGADKVEALERWTMFLVEETPILLYAYYMFRGAVVDFYPGPLPHFMWRIERGEYASELPRTTAAVRASPGLVYVDLSSDMRRSALQALR